MAKVETRRGPDALGYDGDVVARLRAMAKDELAGVNAAAVEEEANVLRSRLGLRKSGGTLSVANIELLRDPIDQARAEGKAEAIADAIERVLQRRFPGSVPNGLTKHLAGFAVPTLVAMFDRARTVDSIEDALGNDMPREAPSPEN